MSSAYESSCTLVGGSGMSDVYMLNRVGDRTLPCGMPVLSLYLGDDLPRKAVKAFRPLR